jgi:hypothetical protein
MSVSGSGKERRRRAVPGKATTAYLERPSVYVNAPQSQNSHPGRTTTGITATSVEPILPGSSAPSTAWGKVVALPGRPGVKPFAQSAGVLSVPGCLLLSGYPVVGIVLFCVAAAIYSSILLVALFGPPEISRRGFRLLGIAEEPGCRHDRTPPASSHSQGTYVRNPPIVVHSDGS